VLNLTDYSGFSGLVLPDLHEFSAYCEPLSQSAYKDSPLRPSVAEIGSRAFAQSGPSDRTQGGKEKMACTTSRKSVLMVCSLALLAAIVVATTSPVSAEIIRHGTPDDIFYNYYVPPVGPGSVGAQMYVSPRPTPPMVGHTYITYQPLMPQEFLYKHRRHYTTKHDDAPRTRTSVHWW
jgi:hypothetical protein